MSRAKTSPEAMVRAMYRELARRCGAQHWWPAETPFEVVVGAILTQNTSWTNVERALARLRGAQVLDIEGIRGIPLRQLEELIRSSGYYRQKAERLKRFVEFVDERYGGSLEQMLNAPVTQLRAELLPLKGIGPETADAILLYAANREVFVVDAYARRILERHGVVPGNAKYDQVRQLVEVALEHQKVLPRRDLSEPSLQKHYAHDPSTVSTATRSLTAQVYNEMHGLLVQIGKRYCHRQEPKCMDCPLEKFLPDSMPPRR